MAEPQFEVSDGKGGLKIESLRKSYRKRLVISDVSMHLHRGEVVALWGQMAQEKPPVFTPSLGWSRQREDGYALMAAMSPACRCIGAPGSASDICRRKRPFFAA